MKSIHILLCSSVPNVTLFHVPVAERNLLQVTGIALDADGTRGHVEFTWNWAATAFARLFPKKLVSGELHAGAVRVQLYDDGWRMGEIVLDLPISPQPQPISATTPEASAKWARAQTNLSAPRLLAPGNGIVFDHYPRNTVLEWKPVSGASSYSIEVQFLSGDGNDAEWCDSFEFVGPQLRAMNYPSQNSDIRTTTFNYYHVGAQKGRWRVWAVDSKGRAGRVSEWWEFTYTK